MLANPLYSIKQWDRAAFEHDKWGRNMWGTPPQGCADYAFFQHIIKSLNEKTGRCAILFPHGVLFRNQEKELRKHLVGTDVLDCIIGLGPNLFYNSPMEACIVICSKNKEAKRKGKVLFINAINEVTRKNAQSYLEEKHIEKITTAYNDYEDKVGFAKVVTIQEIQNNNCSLNISLYVNKSQSTEDGMNTDLCISQWLNSSCELNNSLNEIIQSLTKGEQNG